MQGRFHYYEGHTMDRIAFPVRTFRALGVERLFLTNAGGEAWIHWLHPRGLSWSSPTT